MAPGVTTFLSLLSRAGLALAVRSFGIFALLAACDGRGEPDELLLVSAHLYVLKSSTPLTEYRDVRQAAIDLGHVIKAVAPFMNVPAVGTSEHARGVAMLVKGIDAKKSAMFGRLDKLVVDGSLSALKGDSVPAPIAIGDRLAKHLGVKVGDHVSIAATDSRPEPRAFDARVVAVFHSGVESYDTTVAYGPFEAVQNLWAKGDVASAIEIELSDPDLASEIARKLEKSLGGAPYSVRDWRNVGPEMHGR